MFDYKKLHSFLFQEFYFQYPLKAIGQNFMFLEDENDVVDVQGRPYQFRGQTMDDNLTITIRATEVGAAADYNLFKDLKKSLQFNTAIRYQREYSPEEDVFLGYADMLLLPVTYASSEITLYPMLQFHDQIWVKDLPYTGSKTFFLESFVPTLWLSFLGLFMLCLLLSVCISKMLRNYIKSRIESFNIVSLILDQGVEHVSPIWSHKFVLASLAILMVIFFCGFGAFLSSLLTIRYSALPFDDFYGVLTQNEYSLCLHHRTVSYFMAKFEKRRNKNFIVNINTEDCPSYFRTVNNDFFGTFVNEDDCELGKVVFMTSGYGIMFRKFSKHCNISPMPGKYFRQDTSFLINPGFKHRQHFNRMLVLLRTAGVIRNELIRANALGELLEPFKMMFDEQLQSITFYQIHLILVIFLFGVILALIILSIEIFYKRLYE